MSSFHLRRSARFAVALAVALMVPALIAPRALAATRYVHDADQFQSAVSAMNASGGRIVVLPGFYTRQLVVGPRSGGSLAIIGTQGAIVRSIFLDHTWSVTVQHLSVRPVGDGAVFPHQRPGDAGIYSLASHHVALLHDHFTAAGTRHKVTVDLDHSSYVTVRNSSFTHCGDDDPDWSLCLLPRYANHVEIARNSFHDCRGCDFIHGRFGAHGSIVDNRFKRALVCHHDWVKCGHQDLIELFLANRLVVARNVFGVSQHGGAQLYFAAACDHVRVVNNLFLRTDPRVPGITPRVGILVGTRFGTRLPYDVSIINNTVLSGRLWPGIHPASSIVLSFQYVGVPQALRPLVANNIIARLDLRRIVCRQARASIRNVVVEGSACTSSDALGDPVLSSSHRPTAGSLLLIGRANARLAPPRDLVGRLRSTQPEIGCFEYVP